LNYKAFVVAIIAPAILATPVTKDKEIGNNEPNQNKYELTGEQNVLRLHSGTNTTNNIIIGDSLATLEQREAERKSQLERELSRVSRNTITREGRSVEDVGDSQVLYWDSQVGFNCMAFAKIQGYQGSGHRNAKDIPTNSQTPIKKGFVITYESRSGHIAQVVGVEGDYIILNESNVIRGAVTARRIKWVNNSLIKGYIG
jgi:hypothetical protein